VYGILGASHQLTVGTLELHGKVLHSLVKFNPEEVTNKSLRAGALPSQLASQSAQRSIFLNVNINKELSQLLPDYRILGEGLAIPP
jgi:hypothetical protein